MARAFSLCIFIVSLCVSHASAQSKVTTFKAGSITASFNADNFSSIQFIGVSASDLTPFQVENPAGVVIDIPAPTEKPANEGVFSVTGNACIKTIKVTPDTKKTRIVFDELTVAPGINQVAAGCDYSIKKTRDSLVVLFSKQPITTDFYPSPTPLIPSTTPAPIPTGIVKTIPTPVSTSTPVVNATPSPTIVVTPTQIATAIPTGTPTSTPTPTIAMDTDNPLAAVLTGIEFFHQDSTNQIKLQLTQRVSFKLTREDARRYKIVIPQASVENKGLTLPQFPPNDLVGFTLVQAQPHEQGIEVIIGMDDGMKAQVVNIDQAIVVTAEAAGF